MLLFCAELARRDRDIRRLQRQLDRQRRANNPENYNPDGTVKAGPKTWQKSKRQRQTERKLAELHRQQAAYRRSLHGQLVNQILGVIVNRRDEAGLERQMAVSNDSLNPPDLV